MPSLLRSRFRWWHGGFGLVLLSGVLALVLLVPSSPTAPPAPRPGEPAGPPGSGPLTIVSIGDSTLSGEGAGDYTPETNGRRGNWCHRSPHATIHLTAVPDIEEKVNLACSGANSEHVRLTKATKYTEGSQAAQLRELVKDHRVAAVVVAVGANDDPHFSARLTECAKAWWGGTPCTAAMARTWGSAIASMTPKVIRALADVRGVLTEAGYQDDDYELVLMSYPSPVSPDIPAALRSLDGCPFRVSDLRWIATTGVRDLSTGLRRAADETGARFLDLSRAGAGHEACTGGRDAAAEWFTRLTVRWEDLEDEARASHAAQESYHANRAGHAQIGRCLTEFLATPAQAAACLPGSNGNLRVAPPG